MEEFKKNGIDTRPFFYPVSMQPAYKEYTKGKNYRKLNSVSYQISEYGISLPYSLNLTEDEVDYVCKLFLKILNQFKKV